MSSAYLWLKWLHIVSSTVLFGTGAGIAFFFVRACRSGDVRVIAAVARDVVLADVIFTATAVIVQPISGFAMLRLAGLPVSMPWVQWSLVLYVIAGCCWLPVVSLQLRMRNLAERALREGQPLPDSFQRCYRWWFALGWPAFASVLLIFFLMVTKAVV